MGENLVTAIGYVAVTLFFYWHVNRQFNKIASTKEERGSESS
jgi:hypothetical protein